MVGCEVQPRVFSILTVLGEGRDRTKEPLGCRCAWNSEGQRWASMMCVLGVEEQRRCCRIQQWSSNTNCVCDRTDAREMLQKRSSVGVDISNRRNRRDLPSTASVSGGAAPAPASPAWDCSTAVSSPSSTADRAGFAGLGDGLMLRMLSEAMRLSIVHQNIPVCAHQLSFRESSGTSRAHSVQSQSRLSFAEGNCTKL